ncbi:MAG: response regulator [Spirochaetota bacterium]
MIRILFVDDENNLLEGLKRMLRKKKDEWEMEFANSGASALELLEKGKFNIIVTDYKMPGMDGLELLARVKEKFGETKRIILSGQSEAEIFNRSKEVAQFYLAKPCDPEQIISVIEQCSKN